jgi:hypothetical protein
MASSLRRTLVQQNKQQQNLTIIIFKSKAQVWHALKAILPFARLGRRNYIDHLSKQRIERRSLETTPTTAGAAIRNDDIFCW